MHYNLSLGAKITVRSYYIPVNFLFILIQNFSEITNIQFYYFKSFKIRLPSCPPKQHYKSIKTVLYITILADWKNKLT